MFPVEVHHALDPVPDYLKGTVETVMKIHRLQKEGDVLCFLTGQDEVSAMGDNAVRGTVDILVMQAQKGKIYVCSGDR